MRLNDYQTKSMIYGDHERDKGTIMLAYRELAELFNKYLPPDKRRALDFGCGTGISLRFLEQHGFWADGVDIDENMLAHARVIDSDKTEKYQLIQNNIIPHADNSYDLVFSSLVVLELGSRAELAQYFHEARRVLCDDGYMIIVTTNDDFYKHSWLTVDTDYPENAEALSGDRVRVRLKDIDLELDDFYWTCDDIEQEAVAAGFTVCEKLTPKGSEEDGIPWLAELDHAPHVIFVLKR